MANFPIPSDKCCFVIPQKTGLQILSILTILAAVGCGLTGLNFISINFMHGVVFMVIAAGYLVSAFFCLKWLRNDGAEERDKLVLAMKILLVMGLGY